MAKSALHFGAAGELLVQYRTLRNGIDSARLPTDTGVDFGCLSTRQWPGTHRPSQDSGATDARGRPGGTDHRGGVSKDCPAEYLAVARLSDESAWLFPFADALRLSKQLMPRLYWFVNPTTAPQAALAEPDVEHFRLEQIVHQLGVSGA